MSSGHVWVPAPLSWWPSIHGRRAKGYVCESGWDMGVKSPEEKQEPQLTYWPLSPLDPRGVREGCQGQSLIVGSLSRSSVKEMRGGGLVAYECQ